MTRACKAREVRLTYVTSLLETSIKCASSIKTRKARERKIINNTSLLETSIEYISSIGNVGCNLSISDESNDEFLVDD